jgi:hypothetical protein
MFNVIINLIFKSDCQGKPHNMGDRQIISGSFFSLNQLGIIISDSP